MKIYKQTQNSSEVWYDSREFNRAFDVIQQSMKSKNSQDDQNLKDYYQRLQNQKNILRLQVDDAEQLKNQLSENDPRKERLANIEKQFRERLIEVAKIEEAIVEGLRNLEDEIKKIQPEVLNRSREEIEKLRNELDDIGYDIEQNIKGAI